MPTRRSPSRADSREVMIEAMIESALRSARLAEETGLGPRPDHPVGQGVGRPGPRRGLRAGWRIGATTRSTSA